jgi:NAD(P)H-hydrate epimerase
MSTLPQKLYRTTQLGELERIAREDFNITGITLMHRAAQAVFTYLQTHWTQVKHLAVFCGSGHNAGDGYLIATLALHAQLKVRVYTSSCVTQLTGDTLTAYQSYQQQGGVCVTLAAFSTADLIIDALLGTGLNRTIVGDYAQAISLINQSHCPVLAVDIPSGIHTDTGQVMGCAVKAEATVSLIGLKQGMFTGAAVDYCGQYWLDDLQLPAEIFAQVNCTSQLLNHQPLPPRLKNTHKGDFGHLLIIGGDRGFSGAIRLAAEAALRAGSGLVSLATHPTHAQIINVGRFELICHGIEQSQALASLIKKANVIVLGVGLGQTDWGQLLFDASIQSRLPMVIDADGLNQLAHSPCYADSRILTPHPKEAARLLNCQTVDIVNNRFEAVKAIQAQYGGICILKGAGTLIADQHQLFINPTGNPGMATAGMGDVLAGIIGALVAQGETLIQASTKAVFIHGAAADLAAKKGERGLLAGDLITHIRTLVN